MSSLINKDILKIQAYTPGKPIAEVERELGIEKIIKLASNENPFGCSPKVVTAIKDNLSSINRYPDGNCFYLKKSLSDFLKINQNRLIFGNGSDELLDVIIKAFVNPNEEIITADVAFLEYKICSLVNRRKFITTKLDNFKFDLTAILKKVTKKTKLIFIANPNNPTGTYVNKKEVEDFLKKLPKNVVVVFDEAYLEFVDKDDFPDTLEYLKVNPNIIILRTFSKIYGLAGLRVGFGIASPEFVSVFNCIRQPFNINSLAQVAAIAAISDQDFVKNTAFQNISGKKYLYDELEKLNIEYIPSVTNFILFKVKGSGIELCKKLLYKGVIVRDMEQYNLKNFVRVTIGTKEENALFIERLREIL